MGLELEDKIVVVTQLELVMLVHVPQRTGYSRLKPWFRLGSW